MAIEEVVDQTGAEDVFDTPELEVPKTPPDAHRATITAVTGRHLTNDKQTAIISIALTSRDVPTLETSMDIFVPKGFEENIALGSKFELASLPEEEGNKQQTSYRLGIANSDKTATLQKLVFNTDSVARKAGRNPIELGLTKATDFDSYVENIAKMLTGVEVLFVRRERGGDDPAFSHQLQVRDVFAADEYENNPKRFKKYVLAWENQ